MHHVDEGNHWRSSLGWEPEQRRNCFGKNGLHGLRFGDYESVDAFVIYANSNRELLLGGVIYGMVCVS